MPKKEEADSKNGLLKPREVAVILDCSPDDVSELARKGKTNGFRIGRYWWFRINDVELNKDTYKEEIGKLHKSAK